MDFERKVRKIKIKSPGRKESRRFFYDEGFGAEADREDDIADGHINDGSVYRDLSLIHISEPTRP